MKLQKKMMVLIDIIESQKSNPRHLKSLMNPNFGKKVIAYVDSVTHLKETGQTRVTTWGGGMAQDLMFFDSGAYVPHEK